MFGQLKDMYNLRKQAAAIQKQLEAEKVTASSSNGVITIILNGSHELISLAINKDLSATTKDELANSIKEAYSKAEKELKQILAKKFQGMM